MTEAAAQEAFDTVEQLADSVAARVVDGILDRTGADRHYLLGCPGGRTPRPIFEAIGRRCTELRVDCSKLVIVMMDDYLQPGRVVATQVAADAHYSCRRFAEHEIRGVINRGLDPELGVPIPSVWFPDPREPSAYDARIEAAGGIDLFIVASGASDGHVAFCGPGSDPDGRTTIVPLARSTRTDNLVTFPDFASLDDVPTEGISVGLGTIRALSRAVVMVLHGSDKRESLARVSRTATFDPDWPATFIHDCADARILSDALARGEQNDGQRRAE